MTRAAWLGLVAVAAAFAQAPSGRWDGTITLSGLKVPFRMVFEGGGAALVNGGERIQAASVNFVDGTLRVRFGEELTAKVTGDSLKGTYGSSAVTAAAYCTCAYEGEAGPDISGKWEAADAGWKLEVRRVGDDTHVWLSRPEGKAGPLAGRFNGAFFELAYFDGSRGAVLEIEPGKDGSLELAWKEPGAGEKKHKARRAGP